MCSSLRKRCNLAPRRDSCLSTVRLAQPWRGSTLAWLNQRLRGSTNPGVAQPLPALGRLPWLAFFFERSLRLTVFLDMAAQANRIPGTHGSGSETSE